METPAIDLTDELTAEAFERRLLAELQPKLAEITAQIEAQATNDYTALTDDLSRGVVVDNSHCARILAAAGRTMDDLQADLGAGTLIQASGFGDEPGWRLQTAKPSTAQHILSEIRRLVGLA
jgi:hypothetical protein